MKKLFGLIFVLLAVYIGYQFRDTFDPGNDFSLLILWGWSRLLTYIGTQQSAQECRWPKNECLKSGKRTKYGPFTFIKYRNLTKLGFAHNSLFWLFHCRTTLIAPKILFDSSVAYHTVIEFLPNKCQ